VPDRSFTTWLGENKVRVVFLVGTILVVTFFLMLGLGSGMHQAESLDRQRIELKQAIDEAVKTRIETIENRKAIQSLERAIRRDGDGSW
jgi:hypothetical protein